MDTKEKLEKKLDITKKKILGTVLSAQEMDEKKAKKHMSQELNLGMDTIEKLLSEIKTYKKDKKDYKMVSYLTKITSSGVNLHKDIEELEQKVKNSKETFYKSIDMAKYEAFISEIDAECLNKDILEYLKSSNVEDSIYQKALQKYISNLKINVINTDEVFDFLYANNYKPKNNKSLLDRVFKYYSEGRKKDEIIKNLEQQIIERDDIICGKCNTINELNAKIEFYEQTVPSIKSKIKNYAESAQKSEFNVKQLQKQLEAKEKTGLVKIAFQKVMLLFQKNKPVALSTSLRGIHNEISNLSLGLAQVENSITQPQYEINQQKQIGKQKDSAVITQNKQKTELSR